MCQRRNIPVTIEAKGGGLTVGKFHIDDGTGTFTDVHTIRDVLGTYAQGEAHAGVIKSAHVQLLTKGTVSLALAGAGEGVDLGIAVGEFTLSRRQQISGNLSNQGERLHPGARMRHYLLSAADQVASFKPVATRRLAATRHDSPRANTRAGTERSPR